MLNFNQRKKDIVNHIERQVNLLNAWEIKYDLSENPSERKRCEIEIEKFKDSIKHYQNDYIKLFSDYIIPPLDDDLLNNLIINQIIYDFEHNNISNTDMELIVMNIQKIYNNSCDFKDKDIQKFKSLESDLNSTNIGISGKFKLSIPIIPTILSYETEFGTDTTHTLTNFWTSFWNKLI